MSIVYDLIFQAEIYETLLSHLMWFQIQCSSLNRIMITLGNHRRNNITQIIQLSDFLCAVKVKWDQQSIYQ